MSKHAEVVFLEWVDSSYRSNGGWHDASDWDEGAVLKCFSIGRVITEDKHTIVLANSWDEGADRCLGCIRIPKVAITKRTRIATTAPRKRVKHGR